MNTKPQDKKPGISRRDSLKLSALALGSLAAGGVVNRTAVGQTTDQCNAMEGSCYQNGPQYPTQQYDYFTKLPWFKPNDPYDPVNNPYNTPLQADEMRITFLGSMVPPVRRAQAEMSIFVEVGPWVYDPDHLGDIRYGHATDSFVFDCGSGVCANYGAMNIGYARMDKIFLTHLHADHMSDLGHIYGFGPGGGRFSPLYVWGPSASKLRYKDPAGVVSGPYDDGTKTFCEMLRAAFRWTSESFAFQASSYASYKPPTMASWGLPCEPIPVKDPRAAYDARYRRPYYLDSPYDGYALVPIELDWTKNGHDATGRPNGDNVAYHNKETGVRITHFPVIHCRRGSIGYKLEWKNPALPGAPTLTMIFTGDTKPEINCLEQASNGGKGVDVFIHEMGLPPDVWAMKNLHLDKPGQGDQWNAYVEDMTTVENSSHSPQGSYGYLLSQINPQPRLAVATHFQTADDTVECAWNSIIQHCAYLQQYGSQFVVSFDLMQLRVTRQGITQLQAVVPDFGFSPLVSTPPDLNPPKYWMWELNEYGNYALDDNGYRIPVGDPYAQIDTSTQIQPGDSTFCADGY